MTSLDILAQFITVFLGAFLAFWLENVREKRQLQSQLSSYIRQFIKWQEEDIDNQRTAAAAIGDIIGVYERLIQSENAPTERDWQTLSARIGALPSDMSLLFSGESLSILPADIIAAFRKMSVHVEMMQSGLKSYETFHTAYIVPLTVRRPVTFADTDKRALDLVKSQLENLLEALSATTDSIPVVRERLKQHGYY